MKLLPVDAGELAEEEAAAVVPAGNSVTGLISSAVGGDGTAWLGYMHSCRWREQPEQLGRFSSHLNIGVSCLPSWREITRVTQGRGGEGEETHLLNVSPFTQQTSGSRLLMI